MNFLNPSILFGLLAVLIPVIIHLLNLRKIRKVEFSTLMFLKEIQKSKMRRIKLKQLILLALRMLVITFLVLCFSKPVYEGFAGSKDAADQSVALIFLDDSFSMSSKTAGMTNFERGKLFVKKILESHKESDEIYFIRFSEIMLGDRKFVYENFETLVNSLENSALSDKTTQFGEVLNLSRDILKNSYRPNKEVFIVSDFQSVNFNMSEIKSGSENKDPLSDAAFFLLNTGNQNFKNLSLDSVKLKSGIAELNKQIRLSVNFTNYSPDAIGNKIIKLFANGEFVNEKAVDAEAFQKKEIEFTFNPGNENSINGFFELERNNAEEDELIQDNKVHFSIFVPSGFRIKVIGENQSDLKFLRLAFDVAREYDSDSAGFKNNFFDVNYSDRIDESIFDYAAVVISGKKRFSEREAQIVKNFTDNGGGILLFPGSETDTENYNSVLFGKYNTVLADKIVYTDKTIQLPVISKADFEHPVLSGIFTNKGLNLTSENFIIESPKINSYLNLLPGNNSKALITLSDNSPMLIESDVSKGKLIITSLSASDDMSDFPYKPLFIPITLRSLLYLADKNEAMGNYTVGKQNLIPVTGLKNVDTLVSPGDIKFAYKMNFDNSRDNVLLFPYAQYSHSKGLYALIDSLGNSFNFSLNVDPDESNNSILGKNEIKSSFEKSGVGKLIFADDINEIENSINTSRTGLGLWKYFLIAALVFLLLELFVSKKLEEG